MLKIVYRYIIDHAMTGQLNIVRIIYFLETVIHVDHEKEVGESLLFFTYTMFIIITALIDQTCLCVYM